MPKPRVDAELGGVVVLIKEPKGWSLPLQDGSFLLMDELEKRTGLRVKEVDGPFVNGVYAITFQFHEHFDVEGLASLCAETFSSVMIKGDNNDKMDH